MRLAKKSILYFVSDIGVSLVGFLATLYFARVLGAGILGQYFVVIALLGWLSIPTNGISSAVNKRVSEGANSSAILSAGSILNGAYGAIVVVGIVLAGRHVNDYIGAEVSFLVAGLFLVNIFFALTVEGLKGQKKVARAGFLRTGERIIRSGAQIGFVYIGYSLLGLLVGHTAALAVAALFGLSIYGYRPSLPDRETIDSILAYGRYSWLGNMKNKTFSWMDTLVLAFFVSSSLVGVYEVSWRLASILVLASNAVEHTLFPEISDIASEGNNEEVRELLSEALFYAGIFVIPGFFGVLVLGPKLLRIYGPEFVKGAPILLLLIAARTVNVYEMQMLNVINGIDRPDVAFRINLVFITVNVGLNVLLIWQFGWYGAAIATGISSLVIVALSYRAIDALVGAPALPFAGIGQQILSGAAMAVAVVVADRALPIQNMYVTVGLVVFGAVVYGLTLFALSARIRTKVRSLAVA